MHGGLAKRSAIRNEGRERRDRLEVFRNELLFADANVEIFVQIADNSTTPIESRLPFSNTGSSMLSFREHAGGQILVA